MLISLKNPSFDTFFFSFFFELISIFRILSQRRVILNHTPKFSTLRNIHNHKKRFSIWHIWKCAKFVCVFFILLSAENQIELKQPKCYKTMYKINMKQWEQMHLKKISYLLDWKWKMFFYLFSYFLRFGCLSVLSIWLDKLHAFICICSLQRLLKLRTGFFSLLF